MVVIRSYLKGSNQSVLDSIVTRLGDNLKVISIRLLDKDKNPKELDNTTNISWKNYYDGSIETINQRLVSMKSPLSIEIFKYGQPASLKSDESPEVIKSSVPAESFKSTFGEQIANINAIKDGQTVVIRSF